MDADEIAFEGSWVLVYPDCSLVALDSASGGYPYRAYHLSQVHTWSKKEDAEKYGRMFSEENFELRQAFLGLQKVENASGSS